MSTLDAKGAAMSPLLARTAQQMTRNHAESVHMHPAQEMMMQNCAIDTVIASAGAEVALSNRIVSFCGHPVTIDTRLPANEIRLYNDLGTELLRIVNLATPEL